MNLKDDGTFTVTGVPNEVFEALSDVMFVWQLDWTTTQDLTGTWAPDWNSSNNRPYVVMDIPGVVMRFRLSVDNAKDAIELYAYLGDPDNDERFSFIKS
ncbi:hypothetical protein [Arthrobacter sp. 35W]|uniref:hypothetical protein n=1 Tax=Arthrobacter sp. 35W TaxID=1132441 RepID=UPI00041EA2CB|nr:hypothetical protein [Arthrobacter sp. 35W]